MEAIPPFLATNQIRPRPLFVPHPAVFFPLALLLLLAWMPGHSSGSPAGGKVEEDTVAELFQLLDAPLLFTKQHSYTGIHIYDTFYKWPPGGGGIYVLENPAAPREQWKIRAVIDPTTPGNLGVGVYSYPELSWDAKRLLFCFKGEPEGSTSIYEIHVDGTGLRRVTNPAVACKDYHGGHSGQHDIAPAYLPDGRIVCLSTRPSGLVPCANSGVAILHVLNADGSDMRPISVNHVNEFDPHVLPDGRILFGRWEYVDKNALTIQSLWTINPDGTQETSLFANNMTFPEAVLDARPVPGSQLVVGTLAKHNASPYGSVAFIDPQRGKNSPDAITNLEHPDDPTFDRGASCEPWPISPGAVVFSGRPPGEKRNVLELMDRGGRRATLLSDPDICLHSPMLVKPRPVPPILSGTTDPAAKTGRFYVQDIYAGLDGVPRGEVKWLRVVEETSRVSATGMRGSPFNQVFLVSAALAFSAKNYLGVVPVDESGSAYFEAPSGRALFFQALDADGRLIRSMRTFVQAAPGTTRSCIGCHEVKFSSPANQAAAASAFARPPHQLAPESWGSGYLDYPSMVQPILDRRCVRCHGQEEIAAGLDLSGGWTQYFNISYEALANRAETQLTAYWISGIDCMNGTALWSSPIFPPRSHGSGAAPLARLLLEGHGDRIPDLTRTERDLLMAWMDSNGLYHGTWDYTEAGCAIPGWTDTVAALTTAMRDAGCLRCHGDGKKLAYFENDWINLRDPQLSRILRAPLPAGAEGSGLGFCRDRKVTPDRQRVHLLRKGYAHAVQPPEWFEKHPLVKPDRSGSPVASFAGTADPHYQRLLSIIRDTREGALSNPRVDMPGAEVIAGASRMFNPPPLPEPMPPLRAAIASDGSVELTWERSARTIGLEAELHRDGKLLTRTSLARHNDPEALEGPHTYSLRFVSGSEQSQPVTTSVTVPPVPRPDAPEGLTVLSSSGSIRLQWNSGAYSYHLYRDGKKITPQPIRTARFADFEVQPSASYSYAVTALNRRGGESAPSSPVTASMVVRREPVFDLVASAGEATLAGKAAFKDGLLDCTRTGHASFAHREEFDLHQPLSVDLWVRFEEPGEMPVLISCGQWREAGWFLQKIGKRWRWHVGGLDCDGGEPPLKQWVHVVATFDGHSLRLFQDGAQVGEAKGLIRRDRWSGPLLLGQYGSPPKPPYQVNGQIAGVKLYHRVLTEAEASAASAGGPPP